MTDVFSTPEIDEIETEAPAPEPQEDPKPKPRRRSTGTARRSARTPKPSVRRVAEKAEQIAQTDQVTREVLVELLGAPSDGVADLTTAIMEAKKNPLENAVADLRAIQEGSLPEATIHLVGMDRESLTALVRLAELFSAPGLPEKVPARSTDAALALIEPVREVDVDADSLDHLMVLLAQ